MFIFIGKFSPPSPPKETDDVLLEMNRLRTHCVLSVVFSTLRDVPIDTIQLISHNVQSLRKHINNLKCDHIYINSDIILLQETWALADETFMIDGFREIVRNPFYGRPSAKGTMILAKYSLNIMENTQNHIEVVSGDNRIEMTICVIEGITLINVYKHPKTSDVFLVNTLIENEELFQNNQVLCCGDFNSNFAQPQGKNRIETFFKEKYNMCLLSSRCPTTDDGTTIDAVFGKLNGTTEVISYESIFSFHKPCVIRLKK